MMVVITIFFEDLESLLTKMISKKNIGKGEGKLEDTAN
jgi:hypothetical protein